MRHLEEVEFVIKNPNYITGKEPQNNSLRIVIIPPSHLLFPHRVSARRLIVRLNVLAAPIIPALDFDPVEKASIPFNSNLEPGDDFQSSEQHSAKRLVLATPVDRFDMCECGRDGLGISGSNLHGTEILTRGLCSTWAVAYLKLRISYGRELPI